MYKEDVDLAWRLLLAGWRARYVPGAVGWHARGTGTGRETRTDWQIVRHGRSVPLWVKRMSWRNQRLMQVKNELPDLFLEDLPVIAWREVRSMAYLLLFEPRRLTALPDTIRLVPGALRRRRWIMRRRRASPAEIRRWFRDDREGTDA
jgi:GT2 family glycosyltransferase